MGDEVELSRFDLPSFRETSSCPADAAEAGRHAAGGPLWQGQFNPNALKQNTDAPVSDTRSLLFQMYENFVEEVDAVDNGICQCDGEARYSITTTLSARVGHLNPHWNSKDQNTEVYWKHTCVFNTHIFTYSAVLLHWNHTSKLQTGNRCIKHEVQVNIKHFYDHIRILLDIKTFYIIGGFP